MFEQSVKVVTVPNFQEVANATFQDTIYDKQNIQKLKICGFIKKNKELFHSLKWHSPTSYSEKRWFHTIFWGKSGSQKYSYVFHCQDNPEAALILPWVIMVGAQWLSCTDFWPSICYNQD